MHPVLFQLGSFSIYTYGLFVATGFLFGIAVAMKESRRIGEDPEIILDLSFYLILAGIIGSRLFYILENFANYYQNPLDIFKFWKGGLVFYGGLIPASLVGIWYLKKHNIEILKTLDIITPSAAIGQAFGRLGCFFAGCCHGRECNLPWAVVFTDPRSLAPLGTSLHPTQIYSSLNAFLIFLVLITIRRFKKFEGQVAASYFFLYSITRFTLECFRGDTRKTFFEGALSIAQVLSIGLVIFSLIIFFYLGRKRNLSQKEN